MLSLETTFKEKLRETYLSAPLDAPSFHRHYRVCGMSECEGLCCNGGSGFYMDEEAQTIRRLVREAPEFFKAQGIPLPEDVEQVFDRETDEETGEMELSTNTRPFTYSDGLKPEHFPATSCIFKRQDGACTLQVKSVEEGKPGWWYKPLACWLYPLELQYDGKPHISVAHETTDEYIDDEYPGFVGFTPCGKECKSAQGRPAYQVLEREIAELSRLIGRDLMSEILAYKDIAKEPAA